MIQINQLNLKLEHSFADIVNKAAKQVNCKAEELNNFHIVDVERTNCISAFVGFFKHFSCCYQWHKNHLQKTLYPILTYI